MPANKPRKNLFHPHAQGRDFANTWFVNRLMANQLIDEVRAGDTTPPGPGMIVIHATVENDAAGAVSLGIGPRLHNDKWIAGQWDDGTSTYTDDTADAQDAGADDFATGTAFNNDGHIIGCAEPFSGVVWNVGTDATPGAGYTDQWHYWDGSAWAALTVLAESVDPMFDGVAGGRYEMLFEPPADWDPAVSSEVTGLPTTHPVTGDAVPSWYLIRWRANDAPDVAATVDTIEVYDALRVSISQAGGDATHTLVNWHEVALCGHGEGLAVCTSTADAGNMVNLYGEDAASARTLGAEEGRTYSGQA